ncbi:MAG: MliC family protein [Sphingomonas bacterium]|nr:MliC family protein [Sphingomonas bacterium]
MRLIFTFAAVAAATLVGCGRAAPDNRVAEAKPVQNTPSAPARAIAASFDCGRAKGQAQELVCGDAGLAAMDREVARLAGLAVEPAAAADWAMKRDNCWKSDELRQCVMAAAMLEIHRLRKGSDAARGGDGLSVGPVAFACKGISRPVLATFVAGDSGAVALDWGGEAVAIEQVTTASGARYDGRWNGQPYGFWNKGAEATLTVPGKGDLQCVEQAAD